MDIESKRNVEGEKKSEADALNIGKCRIIYGRKCCCCCCCCDDTDEDKVIGGNVIELFSE